MFCTSCGTQNPIDVRFCIQCGFSLAETSPTEPHPQPVHDSAILQPAPEYSPDPYREPTILQPPPAVGADPHQEPTMLRPPPAPVVDAYHESTMLEAPLDRSPVVSSSAIKAPSPASTPKRGKDPGYLHHAGERIGVYALEEPMGVGGFAEVWKALETTASRAVALKIFYDRVMADPAQARVFRMEARKQAQLEHERVTPIYYCHLDPQDGPPPYYIAMKLMPGGTLEDVLEQKKRLAPPEALSIIRDVLEGLDVAHAAGIIHRDIKPRNVLFDKHGRATLADFGIAKDLKAASQTIAGTVMGTPTYMSPEQSLGMGITQASDIYSVGIMLYEMLAGQPPFTGNTVTEILIARYQGTPPPLSQAAPGISPELERIVNTCLEQEVERRYGDCRSLMHEIDAIRDSASGSAAPSGKRPARSLTARLKSPGQPTSEPVTGGGAAAPASFPTERNIGRNLAILILILGLLAIAGWWLLSRQKTPNNVSGKQVSELNLQGHAHPQRSRSPFARLG